MCCDQLGSDLGRAGLKPMQLHWAPRLRGPAPWWLEWLFIFANYSLRSRIVERLINVILSYDLTMVQIVAYMKVQFDPTRFVIRERLKFWTTMQHRTGESIQKLAARIRQAAAPCDFASIDDPLDEALRTRLICSVNNEAVLKALFKMKADRLDFSTAIPVAIQIEDAAKVAKETVCGP